MLRAGLEPARISPHAPQTCAATNYATSAIVKFSTESRENYFFVLASCFDSGFFSVFAFVVFAAVFVALFEGAGGVAAFESFGTGGTVSEEFEFGSAFVLTLAFESIAGASVVVSGFELKTETPPFKAGIASIKADSINTVAAIIVVFDKTVAVPRDP